MRSLLEFSIVTIGKRLRPAPGTIKANSSNHLQTVCGDSLTTGSLKRPTAAGGETLGSNSNRSLLDNLKNRNVSMKSKDAERCLRAPKFDNLTSEQFDNYWKVCTQYHLNVINTVQNSTVIFGKWPFYKNSSGFRLVNNIFIFFQIDMDYEAAFGNRDGLIKKWEPSI